MTALTDPRRFRIKVDAENEAYDIGETDDPYIYGCYFPSTALYVFDNGDNNDEIEPQGIEYIDEAPREHLEWEIDRLYKKLNAVIEATGVHIEDDDELDEEEEIDDDGNSYIVDKSQKTIAPNAE